jgi:hypothetical protein
MCGLPLCEDLVSDLIDVGRLLILVIREKKGLLNAVRDIPKVQKELSLAEAEILGYCWKKVCKEWLISKKKNNPSHYTVSVKKGVLNCPIALEFTKLLWSIHDFVIVINSVFDIVGDIFYLCSLTFC